MQAAIRNYRTEEDERVRKTLFRDIPDDLSKCTIVDDMIVILQQESVPRPSGLNKDSISAFLAHFTAAPEPLIDALVHQAASKNSVRAFVCLCKVLKDRRAELIDLSRLLYLVVPYLREDSQNISSRVDLLLLLLNQTNPGNLKLKAKAILAAASFLTPQNWHTLFRYHINLFTIDYLEILLRVTIFSDVDTATPFSCRDWLRSCNPEILDMLHEEYRKAGWAVSKETGTWGPDPMPTEYATPRTMTLENRVTGMIRHGRNGAAVPQGELSLINIYTRVMEMRAFGLFTEWMEQDANSRSFLKKCVNPGSTDPLVVSVALKQQDLGSLLICLHVFSDKAMDYAEGLDDDSLRRMNAKVHKQRDGLLDMIMHILATRSKGNLLSLPELLNIYHCERFKEPNPDADVSMVVFDKYDPEKPIILQNLLPAFAPPRTQNLWRSLKAYVSRSEGGVVVIE